MGLNDYSQIRNGGALPDPSCVSIPDEMRDILHENSDAVISKLEELEQAALDYEAGRDLEENATSIRRILHKIKGEFGMIGADEVYHMTHEVESAFEEIPDQQRSDLVLRFKDWTESVVNQLIGNARPSEAAGEEKNTEDNKADSAAVQDSEGKPRCLVVDDNDTARQLLTLFLKEVFVCDTAEDGGQAVEMFEAAVDQNRPYDLICLDVMMPETDGHQALAMIREIEAQKGIGGLDAVKVIMTTALDDSGTIFKAFREGCESYLVKPVSRVKLLEEVEKMGLVSSEHSAK